MLSPILALFARISKPLWLNIRSTEAEVAGGQKTFSSNECSPKTKTETSGFQDQDQDSELQDQDRDQDL